MSGLGTLPEPFSRQVRPLLTGALGAVATAHPFATAAAQVMLARGGSAADAVVAAQAVLAVVMPEACGLGGDAFFMLRDPASGVIAINAAGCAARAAVPEVVRDDGSSVTVPGMVAGWSTLLSRSGRLSLTEVLAPAERLAASGFMMRTALTKAVEQQRDRLVRGGAKDWAIVQARPGQIVRQPILANTLRRIGSLGCRDFYEGPLASAIAATVQAHDGVLDVSDFAAHQTVVAPSLRIQWQGRTVHLQPPMSQGVLLGMALARLEALGEIPPDRLDHAGVELTEASFVYRDRAGEGSPLLDIPLQIDLNRASRRGGPRAYLHTAGVAVADSDGMVIASLVSVFDDFGAAILVRDFGFTLNNRAAGFTRAPNHLGAGRSPVHTLAPILVEDETGYVGMATPGADGQVQSLLQVLLSTVVERLPLDEAIARPRWRSENGRLLIEDGHPAAALLASLGHDVVRIPDGDMRVGSVVAAGLYRGAVPFAVADWRRETWAGAC